MSSNLVWSKRDRLASCSSFESGIGEEGLSVKYSTFQDSTLLSGRWACHLCLEKSTFAISYNILYSFFAGGSRDVKVGTIRPLLHTSELLNQEQKG